MRNHVPNLAKKQAAKQAAKLTPARKPEADPETLKLFAGQAASWWQLDGLAAPLHRLNPPRLRFIVEILAKTHPPTKGSKPLSHLTGLDIGCGAGLVTEPLARLGAAMTGLEPSAELCAAATAHAATQDLEISYLSGTVPPAGKKFDFIVALEVLEHVPVPQDFLAAAASALKPGGVFILSTPARTARSFLITIVGAEYITRQIKQGTHDWRKFWQPNDLAKSLNEIGLQEIDRAGLKLHPLRFDFSLSRHDLSLNFLMAAQKPKAAKKPPKPVAARHKK